MKGGAQLQQKSFTSGQRNRGLTFWRPNEQPEPSGFEILLTVLYSQNLHSLKCAPCLRCASPSSPTFSSLEFTTYSRYRIQVKKVRPDFGACRWFTRGRLIASGRSACGVCGQESMRPLLVFSIYFTSVDIAVRDMGWKNNLSAGDVLSLDNEDVARK